MDSRTPLKTYGMGKVIEIGELIDNNSSKCLSVKIEFHRRRNSGDSLVIESDNIWVKIFDTGADVFKDKARVGDNVFIDGECRIKRGLFEVKVNKFEIYNENTSSK